VWKHGNISRNKSQLPDHSRALEWQNSRCELDKRRYLVNLLLQILSSLI